MLGIRQTRINKSKKLIISLPLAEVLLRLCQLCLEVVVVQVGGAVGFGVEEIQVKEHSKDVVGGERQKEEAVAHCPREGSEEAEDYPIGEPFLGPLAVLGFECLRGGKVTLKVM